VQTVQIICNCFRQRPADLFFTRAKEKHVGILARVPLASGLLTGEFQANSTFASDDHRNNFNRHGESFDVGETFSGVDYDIALAAVEHIRQILPGKTSMTQFALRRILMFDAVTCGIPGRKSTQQVVENCRASDLPHLAPGDSGSPADLSGADSSTRPSAVVNNCAALRSSAAGVR
jgi:aryl-alcohol dehydrogenase-like predicted oxidoreductase